MKAVMYHYVRSGIERPPDYYYLDFDDFRNQLDYFQDNFGFVSYDEFLATVRGNRDSIPEGVVLTFDDGLRGHYTTVYPELKRRGIWGIFYIPTLPYETERLLDVHRIHTLLGAIPGAKLLEHTEAVIEDKMIPHKHQEEFQRETYQRQDDTEATKRVKRILNYFVSDKYKTLVLDRLVERVKYSMADAKDFYIRSAELKEMHDDGMVIGGHTISHPVLSKLDRKRQIEEIVSCFGHLESAVDGLNERTFCYPYGAPYSFDEETVTILNEIDCEWCFKVESADITFDDLEKRSQALPRYDCVDFPHGGASGSIGPGPAPH